jgi:hypothetical protein
VRADQPDEPVLFFSPEPDGNVPGGLIWVSSGHNGRGGWRNDYAKEPPTLYIPLRDLAPDARTISEACDD